MSRSDRTKTVAMVEERRTEREVRCSIDTVALVDVVSTQWGTSVWFVVFL